MEWRAGQCLPVAPWDTVGHGVENRLVEQMNSPAIPGWSHAAYEMRAVKHLT
ncbi:unnamed protein product [Gulo gulo]|uniref:Uncharacterized protein n=1 Tax=Gulo gulo TaxID=48420 RepID=A0A9X9M753_GULGU|nr:unnamed protein product [Gulo gulo]